MSLHDEIQNHINELQDLLKESNEETLLDKARQQWGEEDSRYEVLEQFVESPPSSRFSTRAKPAESEPSGEEGGSVQNKPIK
jgi:hypothetical protein